MNAIVRGNGAAVVPARPREGRIVRRRLEAVAEPERYKPDTGSAVRVERVGCLPSGPVRTVPDRSGDPRRLRGALCQEGRTVRRGAA